MLQSFLNPASIVVIGASEDTGKPGGRLLHNLATSGFRGELLVVHPRGGTIQGLQAWEAVTELPSVPELAFIAVPAPLVGPALEALAALGTKAVVVLSAGFGEIDAEGRMAEQRLARIADDNGMRLLGPNCLGVMSTAHAGKFAGILPAMRQDGMDFVSGSGATVDYLAEQAVARGLPFRSFLTVGNGAQTGVADLLALFDQQAEPGGRIKLLYLETLHKPLELLRAARSLGRKGCVLAGIKAGTTQAGSRAAASHTGAMASNDAAVQALFDKAGILRVQSRQELIDLATALVCLRGRHDGRRVAIITDAGGPGVLMADELSRQGLEVPVLGERTQRLLKEALPPGAGVGNPIDCLPSRSAGSIAKVFDILRLEEAGKLDYLAFVMGDSGLADNGEIFQVLLRAMDESPVPVLPSLCTAVSSREALEAFRRAGRCYFQDEVDLAIALGRILRRPRLSEPPASLDRFDRDRIAAALAGHRGLLSAGAARAVAAAAGLQVPAQHELADKAGLAALALPFPWVMKVLGPSHKSDLGGVRAGIASLAEAEAAWDELRDIPGACGCLVQELVPGSEVILGASREEGFGHLVAFGLGGIYTEALKDVHFALAPLSREEAEGMIRAIRAYPILRGLRGHPGMDLDLLADWLVRVGRLVSEFPRIRELDLNPVKGQHKHLSAVDIRILLD
jgi:acetyltransferase